MRGMILDFLDWLHYGDRAGKVAIALIIASTVFAFVGSAVMP